MNFNIFPSKSFKRGALNYQADKDVDGHLFTKQ